MNVAKICKIIPAYLPHELLGFNKDSVPGMLLTIDLVNEIIEQENEAQDPNNKFHGSRERFNKFNRLR